MKLQINIGACFGALTVIEEIEKLNKYCMYLCVCNCGEKVVAKSSQLVDGSKNRCRTCGRKAHDKAITKHGYFGTRIYKTWGNMKRRCLNPKAHNYHLYGGRGIKVCKSWLEFENFLADMGEPPTDRHSLERINNDGDYKPSNCRWALMSEQALNRRDNRNYNYRGKTQSMLEWAIEYNMNYTTLQQRLDKGASIKEALETPIGKWRKS